MNDASRFPEASALIRQANDAATAGRLSPQLEQRIDEDILELEGALQQLRAARNACRPLLRLPLEVLGEIAEILVSIWPAYTGYPKSTVIGFSFDYSTRGPGLKLGWVLLGHVCHKLRSALLARTDLWAQNICSLSRKANALLSYCGSALTHIDMLHDIKGYADYIPSSFIDLVVKCLPTSRMISIKERGRQDNSGASMLRSIKPSTFSVVPYPHLEHLSLQSDIQPNQSRATRVLTLPIMVAPLLRSLHLKNYTLPLDPSGLTSLTLEFNEPTYFLSSGALLGVLRRSPQLIQLKLHNCITELPQKAEAGPVPMTQLETVDIKDTLRRCVGILCHLASPTSTQYTLRIDNTTDAQEPTHLEPLVPFLQTRDTPSMTGLGLFMGSTESGFALYKSAPLSVSGKLHYSGPSLFSAGHGYHEQVHITFTHGTHDGGTQVQRIINSLSTATDCGTIEALGIILWSGSVSYSSAFWKSIFAHFPGVATLSIAFMWNYAALYDALAVPFSFGHSSDVQDDIMLPRLSYLWPDVLDLRATSLLGLTSTRFLRMLSSRSQAGKPIGRLRTGMLLVQDPVEAREELVPSIEELVELVEIDEVDERHPDTDIGGSDSESSDSDDD
ncbi:unnamed protein product [Peniophora sp. CBMAI 1063]|nr:unnamed protein product [Peniophora sp. CBMAI 1063]